MKKYGISFVSFFRFAITYFALWITNYTVYDRASLDGSTIIPAIISILFGFILLYSLSRLLILHEKKELLYEGEKTSKEKARFLLHRKKTLIAFVAFFLLPLPYPAISALFPTSSFLLAFLSQRILLIVYFPAFLLGGMAGLTYREIYSQKRINNTLLFFILHTIKYAALYSLGGFALAMLLLTLISFSAITILILASSFGTAILLIFGGLWTVRIVRAILKRRTFLAKLSKTCREAGLPKPHIARPIRSLFVHKTRGAVFDIVIGKKTFTCKILSTLRPSSTYRFYSNGIGARVKVLSLRLMGYGAVWGLGLRIAQQRAELWETQFDFGFDAPEGGTKVLIFNPCSRVVEGAHMGQKFSLDSGMAFGEYFFYTGSGFCNAILRGCLGRRQ